MLSKKALELLQVLFSEESNLQVPIGLAGEVIEIREWIKRELEKVQADSKTEEK